ncbi:hypothetical protein GCM10023159_09390 [Brevibacterium yomogidense]
MREGDLLRRDTPAEEGRASENAGCADAGCAAAGCVSASVEGGGAVALPGADGLAVPAIDILLRMRGHLNETHY